VLHDYTYLCSLDELVLSGFHILGLATPCGKYGSLQGTTVAEGEGPWLAARATVDGVQVDGSIFLRLTTRQEGHT
jgi:hypothetical protein